MKEKLLYKNGARVLVLRPIASDLADHIKLADMSNQTHLDELWKKARQCTEYQVMGWLTKSGKVAEEDGTLIAEPLKPGDCFTSEHEVKKMEILTIDSQNRFKENHTK